MFSPKSCSWIFKICPSRTCMICYSFSGTSMKHQKQNFASFFFVNFDLFPNLQSIECSHQIVLLEVLLDESNHTEKWEFSKDKQFLEKVSEKSLFFYKCFMFSSKINEKQIFKNLFSRKNSMISENSQKSRKKSIFSAKFCEIPAKLTLRTRFR